MVFFKQPASRHAIELEQGVDAINIPLLDSSLAALEPPPHGLIEWDRLIPVEHNAVRIGADASPELLKWALSAPHVTFVVRDPIQRDYHLALAEFNRWHDVDIRIWGDARSIAEDLDVQLSKIGRFSRRGRLPSGARDQFVQNISDIVRDVVCVDGPGPVFLYLKSVASGDSKDMHIDKIAASRASAFPNEWMTRATTTHAGPGMEWVADTNVRRDVMPDGHRFVTLDNPPRDEGEYLFDPQQISRLATHSTCYFKVALEGKSCFQPPVHRAFVLQKGERRLRSMICVNYH